MENSRDHLIDWLRDAHAMEKQAVELLEKQAGRLDSYPQIQSRVSQHVQETRRQADRLEQCLNQLDTSTSGMKNVMGWLTGNLGAINNAMADDEVVKNMIGNFAFENFEIACYRSLIAAAEALGETYIADTCRDILVEEEAMAGWAASNIDLVTRAFLERDMAGINAKR